MGWPKVYSETVRDGCTSKPTLTEEKRETVPEKMTEPWAYFPSLNAQMTHRLHSHVVLVGVTTNLLANSGCFTLMLGPS
jgi:hypothetical protein